MSRILCVPATVTPALWFPTEASHGSCVSTLRKGVASAGWSSADAGRKKKAAVIDSGEAALSTALDGLMTSDN